MLAEQLPPRAVIRLSGALGSGKTTLIRGIVSAVSSAAVSSPTYVYHQRYLVSSTQQAASGGPTNGSIDHVDLYRVHTDPTLRARTGIDELLAAVPGWLLIEWPLDDLAVPADIPVLTIAAGGPSEFRFDLVSSWPITLSEGAIE